MRMTNDQYMAIRQRMRARALEREVDYQMRRASRIEAIFCFKPKPEPELADAETPPEQGAAAR